MATFLRVFRDIAVGHAVVASGMNTSNGTSKRCCLLRGHWQDLSGFAISHGLSYIRLRLFISTAVLYSIYLILRVTFGYLVLYLFQH